MVSHGVLRISAGKEIHPMIDQATLEKLKQMRLGAMASELENQFKDQATYSQLGFEERLGMMVDAECSFQNTRCYHRRD